MTTTPVKRPVVHTLLILDQSGSMEDIAPYAVKCYCEEVQQAQLNSVDQDIYMSLLTFRGEVYDHLWCVPASELRLSTVEDYRCAGGTALNDALGYGVLRMQQSSPEGTTMYYVKVITDGEENSSKRFGAMNGDGVDRSPELYKLIQGVQETKKWTITFMGCSENYLEKLATAMHIPKGNMAAWSSNNAGAAVAMGAVASNKLYRGTARGVLLDAAYGASSGKIGNFMETEEKTAGGILAAASASVGNVASLACNSAPAANIFVNQTSVNWADLKVT